MNLEFPLTYHNDLRLDPAIIAVYRTFVEGAERPVLRTRLRTRSSPSVLAARRSAPSRKTLAATGVGSPAALAAVAAYFLAAIVACALLRGRTGG